MPVAPLGARKTVLACTSHPPGLHARPGRPQALADQRRTRIAEFLGIMSGQLGGGRAKLHATIDVITLQTLSRRRDIPELR